MLKCAVFAFDYKGFVSLQAQAQSSLKRKQSTYFTDKKESYCLRHYLCLPGRKIKTKETETVKGWSKNTEYK